MSELIVRLQKNVFGATVLAAVFLGFSMAYFATYLVQFMLDGGGIPVATQKDTRTNRAAKGRRQFRSVDSFYPVASGNLIRDSEITTGSRLANAEKMPSGGGEITVLGMISGSPSFARVAIQSEQNDQATEYKTGDEVAGYRIVSINHRDITVERGGQRLSIGVGESSGEVKKGKGSDATLSSKAPDAPDNARRITLTRDKLMSLMKDQSELYKNKFAPITGSDGDVLGYRMIYVPPDNFLYQLGARSGDILRRVNGEPLNSTEKMIEFYNSLKTVDRLMVDIERAGKIQPYEILIR